MFNNLVCSDFADQQLANETLKVKVGEDTLTLTLRAVTGSGDLIHFLFKGEKKARFSIGKLYEKSDKWRSIIDNKIENAKEASAEIL